MQGTSAARALYGSNISSCRPCAAKGRKSLSRVTHEVELCVSSWGLPASAPNARHRTQNALDRALICFQYTIFV